ncbi:MAG: hypothetical protein RML36_07900 [Anaerolineae bacterium]|nr:YbjN domain-containing protein [Anaerolineae bacterium]MDW8099386.1 hypothetical protein [Anaerolineae bacterium]
MKTSLDETKEMAWLQQVKAFCQGRGWTWLEIGSPPRLLVQWPVDSKPMLVQVATYAEWGVMFLVPLGNIPQELRQATLLAASMLNYRLSLACLELEPIQGEARIRVTLTPGDKLPDSLLECAFQALEEGVLELAKAIAAFEGLKQIAEALQGLETAQEEGPSLWNSRPATD